MIVYYQILYITKQETQSEMGCGRQKPRPKGKMTEVHRKICAFTSLTLLHPSQLRMMQSKYAFSSSFKRLPIAHFARAARRPCYFIFHLCIFIASFSEISCLIIFTLFRFTLALASYIFFSKFRSMIVSNAKADKRRI